MADLADMIQKLSYYQAGGKDPGTDTLDKVNTGTGIIDSTIKEVLAIKKAKAEQAKMGAETSVANRKATTQHTQLGDLTPDEFKDMAQGHALLQGKPPSGTHWLVNKQTGKVVGQMPGMSDSITTVGEETLPTYKKSELLAMSPDARAMLGKYKVVDDTAPNKIGDDNQTVDSILSGIDNLVKIRQTMGTMDRGATLIPGGTTVGKLVSAPLSSWQTEKNLLAQRLGKLVEKNRMSDEDRKFYLNAFNSPASTDEAFSANISSLKTAIAGIKKSAVQGGPGQSSGLTPEEQAEFDALDAEAKQKGW